MGTSHSVAEFTGKINRAGTNLKEVPRPALNAAALAAKTVMVPTAPKFLRGVGRKGAKIGVRYTLFGNNKAVVRWYGPAHLLNNPNRPHDIGPKRRGGKRAVLVGGQPYAKVHHPGTRGKGFFQRSKPKAQRAASNAYSKTVRDAVAQPFR